MQSKKKGFPEENEIVVCTVTKIQFHSVFVNLDEYNKSGMIHISEISPGRIRNLNDFVKEGKVIVCKVLKINQERGHIDLSLRRVNENQKKEKIDEVKQSQKAEKIIEYVCEQKKQKFKPIYDKIQSIVLAEYDSIYGYFEDFIEGNVDLKLLKLDAELTDYLEEIIRQRIKPPEIIVEANIKASSYAPNGVEIIKNAFKDFEGIEDLDIKYQGGGNFRISVKDSDYKIAEKKLKENSDAILNNLEKSKCIVEFKKLEHKK
jgi:translation initiation factor 2 subunit 1